MREEVGPVDDGGYGGIRGGGEIGGGGRGSGTPMHRGKGGSSEVMVIIVVLETAAPMETGVNHWEQR